MPRIQIYVNDLELQAIQNQALEKRLSVSSYMKTIAKRENYENELLSTLKTLLKKINKKG